MRAHMRTAMSSCMCSGDNIEGLRNFPLYCREPYTSGPRHISRFVIFCVTRDLEDRRDPRALHEENNDVKCSRELSSNISIRCHCNPNFVRVLVLAARNNNDIFRHLKNGKYLKMLFHTIRKCWLQHIRDNMRFFKILLGKMIDVLIWKYLTQQNRSYIRFDK